MTTFAELGVRPRTLAALDGRNITRPLPVQEEALPPLLEGRDAVIQAPTGSGKTLAFALPITEHLHGHARGGPRALIIVPTRELAGQIAAVLGTVDPQLRVALLIGGVGLGGQLNALRREPDVVVGCPGRILDLAARRAVRFDGISHLVLDEADEMLDQGFAPDVERIIALTPTQGTPPRTPERRRRQTILASATMPDWVQRMVDRHLVDPVRVKVSGGDQEPSLEHGLVRVRREERIAVLSRVLGAHGGSAIVFHRTKHGARKLARDLEKHGHRSSELQGNLSQNARDRAISDFRALRTDVLVATNVAARGLDIEHVRLVVNYELPESAQWLTHRVGRTARNGVEGRALTFLSDDDLEQWRKLRRDGAPDLPWIDLDILVDTGSMKPAPQSAAPTAPPAGATRSPRPAPAQRVQPDRSRRDRPSLPARAPLAARSPLPARSRHVAGQRRPAGAHAQQQGIIGKLVADRGFGFITGDDGEKYFFHRSGARDGFDTLRGGERVSFVSEAGAKGRRAAAVTLTRS